MSQTETQAPTQPAAAAAELPPPPSGDITTPILFSQRFEEGETPYMYMKCPPPEGVPYTNIRGVPSLVPVHDLRGQESSVTLDHDSIQIVTGLPEKVKEVDFDNEAEIERIYYPWVEQQMLAHVPGAKRIHIYLHGIRHTKNFPVPYNPPAMICHLDHTGPAVADRVRRHLPSDADDLLQGRYRCVHFWQSLNGPVHTCPVAVASSASVRDADLIRMESHLKDFSEDFAAPIYADRQKWYYLSGIDSSEAMLIQIYDSDATKEGSPVRGGRGVNGAFRDPRTPENAPPRWSIEVSCLVFGD